MLVVLLVIAIALAVFFYSRYRDSQNKLADPKTTTKSQIADLKSKIGRHVLLPTNEQPSLGNVPDASQVKKQKFFVKAANGDQLLIYTKAKLVILYRPSIDRVINIAPLTVNTKR